MSLIELAERVEKASGPSHELDLAIHEAVFRSPVLSADEIKRLRPEGRPVISGCMSWHGALTASLDAAMSLVPEGWWVQHIGQCIGGWRARVETNGPPSASIASGYAPAEPVKDAALALCAAALRARAQQTGER